MSNTPPPIPPTRDVFLSPPLQPPSRGMSGFAITGFVFSMFLCVPIITQVIGLVLGLIGLIFTGPNKKAGRGFAITAVLVSLVGVISWTVITNRVYHNYIMPSFQLVKFSERLAKGDPAGAATYTAAPFDNETLPELITRLKAYGTYKTVVQNDGTASPFGFTKRDGNNVFLFKGRLTFEHATADAHVELTQLNKTWKITRFDLTPVALSVPATLPATTLPSLLPSPLPGN